MFLGLPTRDGWEASFLCSFSWINMSFRKKIRILITFSPNNFVDDIIFRIFAL